MSPKWTFFVKKYKFVIGCLQLALSDCGLQVEIRYHNQRVAAAPKNRSPESFQSLLADFSGIIFAFFLAVFLRTILASAGGFTRGVIRATSGDPLSSKYTMQNHSGG